MNRTLQHDRRLATDPTQNGNSFGRKKFSTIRSDARQKSPRELKAHSSRGETRTDGMISISPKGYLKKAFLPSVNRGFET